MPGGRREVWRAVARPPGDDHLSRGDVRTEDRMRPACSSLQPVNKMFITTARYDRFVKILKSPRILFDHVVMVDLATFFFLFVTLQPRVEW